IKEAPIWAKSYTSPNCEVFMKKNFFLLALLLGFFITSAFAGNTDSIGAKGLWDIVSGWLNDTYVSRIIALLLFCVGVWRAFAGSILQFFLMLGFAVLVTQGSTIIETINSATF
ncbi:hypothetical protein ACM12L_000370, partial [Campylobacter jejuni]